MTNPFTQFKFAFELWVASVFGIYSQDFYECNEWMFSVPKYTQENLTGRFWQDINEGWDFMQPNMIEYLKEFNSFGEN
jgi:hypothetical protein